MKIFKYQQWLDESEEVAPVPAAEPVAAAPSTDTLPEEPAALPVDASTEMPAVDPAEIVPTDAPIEGELSEYEQIDSARKDSIRAFKAKYEEFKNAPEDQREIMKDELAGLYNAMKEAVDRFDELVGKEIGAEAAPEIEDEP
jgi:hypothetical protein